MHRGTESHNLVDRWLQLITENNFELAIGGQENAMLKEFNHHRHDQSILSFLWNRSNMGVLEDECFWSPDWSKGHDYPLWNARNRLYISVARNKFPRAIFRIIRKLHISVRSRQITRHH